MSFLLSPFGQELRQWRRRRGLSQFELSVLAETTPRHVSFIETGRSRPRPAYVRKHGFTYPGVFEQQKERLARRSIHIFAYSVSHLAFRTRSYEEYLGMRGHIEQHCVANVENVWNGRPISKMLLQSPLDLGGGFDFPSWPIARPSGRGMGPYHYQKPGGLMSSIYRS